MPRKILTPEIVDALSSKMPENIPLNLLHLTKKLGIKDIYLLHKLNLSDIGVYGSCIVILNNGQYIDLQNSPETVDAIIKILSKNL